MCHDAVKFPSQAIHTDTIYSNTNYCNLKALLTHGTSEPCPSHGDCTQMNQG